MSTTRVVDALETFAGDADPPFGVRAGDIDGASHSRPQVIVREVWRRLQDGDYGPRLEDPTDVRYEGEAVCEIRAGTAELAEEVEDEIVRRQGRSFAGTPVDEYWFLESSDATDLSKSPFHIRRLALKYTYNKVYEDPGP